MTTRFFGNSCGNTISVGGLVTNQNSGNIALYGLGDALHANGGLINNGFVLVLNGSSIDPPFLNNVGIVGIDNTSKFVAGTGAASGQGYIQLVNGHPGRDDHHQQLRLDLREWLRLAQWHARHHAAERVQPAGGDEL